MTLLTSQKNQLFDLIIAWGLEPTRFEFCFVGDARSADITTELSYRQTPFFYRFATGIKGGHSAIFSPGKETLEQAEYPGDWDNQINYFVKWIQYLLREIQSEDKWAVLQAQSQKINLIFNDVHDRFSDAERESIKTNIEVLKIKIVDIGFSVNQLEAINAKLDHLSEATENLNKIDWKELFIGGIIAIILQLSIPPENSVKIWQLIHEIFTQYILPQ